MKSEEGTLGRAWRAGWWIVTMLAAAPVSAALRSPQVPVSGTALTTFFASQSQTINPNADQLDLQRANLTGMTGLTVPAGVLVPQASGSIFGLYNASLAVPPLYLVFPGAATNGWFATASFRTLPTRLVVNLFDASATIQGSVTYIAGPPDPSDMGFYVQDSNGLFYSQDARNSGGASRILAFAGTGARAGATWFACETGAGPGGDFADVIFLTRFDPATVPAVHTGWGRLKQLFR